MRLLAPFPGTYCLKLFLEEATLFVHIGRSFSDVTLDAGYYLYCGSAFGPGGVSARVRRHYQIDKRKRWYIDFLRPAMVIQKAWVTYDLVKRECDWAQVVHQRLGGQPPRTGMGASDCTRCPAHFFSCAREPTIERFIEAVSQAHPPLAEIEIIDESWIAASASDTREEYLFPL